MMNDAIQKKALKEDPFSFQYITNLEEDEV